MKRSAKLFGLVIFLSLLLTGAIVFATGGTSTVTTPTAPAQPGTTPKPDQKCCIAGEYKGHHKDIPSRTCPKPGEGDFKMIINQDKGCGSKIWGKVIDPDGTTNEFTGTVTPGRDGCCNISGFWTRPGAAGAPGERVDFKGLLCKKGGKWTGSGDYRSTRGATICDGKWNMTQI